MPIQAADSKAVRVAGFCVHLDAREVRRDDGSLVPLQDKPFSVLAVLLERPGELVTRDDLRQRLWPGDTFVDFEHGINTAVRKLREALADSAEQPRIIETLPRRGYRCIAQVAAPNAPVARERILMLPFANLNGEREDPLSYALTERMTAQLGRVCKTIDVLAPLSVLHARDAQTADTIRRELHADYALTGSVLCADGQIRITAKLICCADQRCVWSESYTRPGHEIFAVQDNITRNIARAIAKVFSHEEENAANARLNTTSAVYVKYLVARHWNQSCSVGGFLKAKEQAEAVIHDDPEFAPAYGFLALLHATLAAWGVVAGAQAYPQVEAWARRGLALSKRLEEAECALGWKLLDWDADFAEAERHLHRAIEINPSFPLPHILAGQSAAAQGKHSKASAAIERALELDPVSPQANTTAGCIYYLAGHWQRALEYFERTIQLYPALAIAHVSLSWVYQTLGEMEKARACCEKAVACDPQNPVSRATLAQILALTGNVEGSKAILQDLLTEGESGGVPAYWIAQVYVGLGDLQRAMQWLETAFVRRCSWRLMAGSDPKLRPLAHEPRFRFLVAAAGLSAREIAAVA